MSSQNQVNDDEIKMERGWNTFRGAHSGGGPISEEQQFEPTRNLSPERHGIGPSGDQDRSRPSFMQDSSFSHTPQCLNLNAGYVGNSCNVGSVSRNCDVMVHENDDEASSSLGGWGLSCKRKAVEGTSAASYSAGNANCFQQAENRVFACYDTSSNLSLSPPSRNSLGVGTRAVEDFFSSLGSIGNTENCPIGFGRIRDPRSQRESIPLNLSSRDCGGPPMPNPFSDSLELRSTSALGANINASQNQTHAVHVSAFSRNVHDLPWSGASSARDGNLLSSSTSGESVAALQQRGSTRIISGDNPELPVFVPSFQMRNMVQDPTSWGLTIGSSSGDISSTTLTGSSSSSHPLPHHIPSRHDLQRVSEFSRSLFPYAPQNLNLNAGYMGNRAYNGQGTGLNLCISGGLQMGQASLAVASSEKVGSSSGSSGFIVDGNNGGSGSSLSCWGLPCKRKALEGTSAQSCSAGSSRCFPQSEVSAPAHTDVYHSLRLSPLLQNPPTICPLGQSNPRFGVGVGAVEDGFPPGITGNTENNLRSIGRRGGPRQQQESVSTNLSSRGSSRRSNIALPHSPAISLPFSDSPALRSTAGVCANIIAPQIQPHAVHVSAFSHNVHRFPSRGASSSRAGSLFSSSTSGERVAALQEEGHERGIPGNNTEHLIPSAEIRNMDQDSAYWGFVSGSSSGGVSSTTRVRSSSSIQPLPGSAWIPHPIPSTHSHRMMSEIRQVLTAMRRGENFQIEDFRHLEPFIYHGLAEMHDRHRDMRLDVDNMSYEELLALEERIGDVSTGVSEEKIMKTMKQTQYMSVQTESPSQQEPCCICQEEYAGGDDLGTLDCGHNFHTNCIKQWLMRKNLCPICKTTALPT